MRYSLGLQWVGSSLADLDAVVDMEDALDRNLGDCATVDGHAVGPGDTDVFIDTDDPVRTFADAQRVLGGRAEWAGIRAAYREAVGDDYCVLWPPTLRDFTVA